MRRAHTFVESPADVLTLVADDGVLSGLFMTDQKTCPSPDALGDRDDAVFVQASEELTQYFAGERTTFEVPLAPVGNAFQQEVWNALKTIPYGETATYGEIAVRIGRPDAARVVGTANGQNPICIIVPCHRVIGANGSLVGYAGGLERKQMLLELEQARSVPQLFA